MIDDAGLLLLIEVGLCCGLDSRHLPPYRTSQLQQQLHTGTAIQHAPPHTSHWSSVVRFTHTPKRRLTTLCPYSSVDSDTRGMRWKKERRRVASTRTMIMYPDLPALPRSGYIIIRTSMLVPVESNSPGYIYATAIQSRHSREYKDILVLLLLLQSRDGDRR